MKKRVLWCLAVMALFLGFEACGTSAGPLDLKGQLLKTKTFDLDPASDFAKEFYSCPGSEVARAVCADLPIVTALTFNDDNVLIQFNQSATPRILKWTAFDPDLWVTSGVTQWKIKLTGKTLLINRANPLSPPGSS